MSVCIFSTVNEIEAKLVKTTLDEKGIGNFVKNSSTLAYLGANLPLGSMDVYVKEEDANEALDIINSLLQNDNIQIIAENDENSEFGYKI